MTPLISIVVPTLNQAAYIEQTLASLAAQGDVRLEIIVIDGGSTDGTREIVERYPVTHFISERDSGQAEAINKGFRLAKGDILAWLNSDDYYLPLTLARAVAALGDPAQPALIYGNGLLWYEEEQRPVVDRGRPFDREALRYCDYITQPATFWTRALWEKTGELDQAMRFTLDWDWWLRASAHCDLRHLDQTLAVYRIHAQHLTSSGSPKRVREIVEFVERHASAEWAAAFRDVAKRVPIAKTRFWKLHMPDLILRHGKKAEVAFWQLNM